MHAGVKPARRWLQFGVRTALVMMLVLGVGLGYWCDRAARLRKTVAALESLDVDVYWDGGKELAVRYGVTMEPPETPGGFGWLGPEFLHSPTSVVLGANTPLEQTVPHLQTLPQLAAIYVWCDEERARAAFAALARMPGVELFVLRRGRCGDLVVDSLTQPASNP